MKNLILQEGNNITVAAPADVTSGQGVLVGSLFGVASTTAESGDPVAVVRKGAYRLAKATGQAWTVGLKLYWDNTAKNVTSTATDNTLIGVALAAAASGDTVGDVLLGIVA